MDVIGAICAGLAWGWLAAHVHQPASRPLRSLTILVVATVAGAVQQWWQVGIGSALLFGLAALFGTMGHGAWIEELKQRGNVG